jgi:T5SS/PEP-CTERM-associated repeat protein
MPLSRRLLHATILAALTLPALNVSAQTFVNTTGTGDWFTAGNWSNSTVPVASSNPGVGAGKTAVIASPGAVGTTLGLSNGSTLDIHGGGTGSFTNIFFANDSATLPATLSISGAGSRLTLSSFSYVSYYNGGVSNLSFSNGGSYQTGTDYLGWGSGSSTTLELLSGAHYTAGTAYVAYNVGTTASFTASGVGTTITTTGEFKVGNFGQATLSVSDGVTASTGNLQVAAGSSNGAGGSSGNATITGSTTSWQVSGNVGIGSYSSATQYANGTLTLADGARLTSTGSVNIARNGTFNIGTGGVAGILSASRINFTDTFVGTGVVNFNHSDALIFSTPITGYGTLTKKGAGTLTLTNSNGTFYGPTLLYDGTLRLGAANALGSAGRPLSLLGGILDLNGYSLTVDQLTLLGSTAINFGAGSNLYLYNTAAINWTGTLSLTNFVVGSNLLYVGSNGLTATQLSELSLAGYTATGINGSGYVTFTASAIPEPSTYAALAGLSALTLVAYRRRQAAAALARRDKV